MAKLLPGTFKNPAKNTPLNKLQKALSVYPHLQPIVEDLSEPGAIEAAEQLVLRPEIASLLEIPALRSNDPIAQYLSAVKVRNNTSNIAQKLPCAADAIDILENAPEFASNSVVQHLLALARNAQTASHFLQATRARLQEADRAAVFKAHPAIEALLADSDLLNDTRVQLLFSRFAETLADNRDLRSRAARPAPSSARAQREQPATPPRRERDSPEQITPTTNPLVEEEKYDPDRAPLLGDTVRGRRFSSVERRLSDQWEASSSIQGDTAAYRSPRHTRPLSSVASRLSDDAPSVLGSPVRQLTRPTLPETRDNHTPLSKPDKAFIALLDLPSTPMFLQTLQKATITKESPIASHLCVYEGNKDLGPFLKNLQNCSEDNSRDQSYVLNMLSLVLKGAPLKRDASWKHFIKQHFCHRNTNRIQMDELRAFFSPPAAAASGSSYNRSGFFTVAAAPSLRAASPGILGNSERLKAPPRARRANSTSSAIQEEPTDDPSQPLKLRELAALAEDRRRLAEAVVAAATEDTYTPGRRGRERLWNNALKDSEL
jgi:hypothetical protein